MTLRAKLNRMIAPLVAVILLLLYVPFALRTEAVIQAEALRSVQSVAMLIIFIAFVAKFRRVFSREVPDSARRFYLGLILWSSAAAAGAIWRLMWRIGGGGDNLDWMITNSYISFPLWMEIVGIFFMLSGPAIPGHKLGDMTPGDPEDISWRRLIIAAALCAGITYMVVVERIGTCVVRDILARLQPA